MANRAKAATAPSISSSAKILFTATFAALALVAIVAATGAKAGAAFDGAWKVTIITQSGNCDPAYSYPVKVESGRVTYSGDGSFEISGNVGDAGSVNVSIARGDQKATGSGKLTATSGSGQWTGKSSSTNCSGRWEATRAS